MPIIYGLERLYPLYILIEHARIQANKEIVWVIDF